MKKIATSISISPSRIKSFVIAFIAFFITFYLIIPVYTYSKETTKQDETIHITSKTMEAMDKEGKVIFIGNVVAKRRDLTIYSDKLIMYYLTKKDGKTKERRILKKLVAQGNVRIIQGEKTGQGQKAVYDKQEEVIVLSGNAQVWQGKSTVRGDKITFYINEDKSIVESRPGGRVEAVVYPGKR